MAKFELNIYGKDDEIVKSYQTDHIRFGVFLKAIEIQDKLDDMSTAEQFKAVCTIVKQIFTGLTDDEIMLADMQDVFSIYKQASRQGLNSSNEKN
jgi:hypothetical protein